MSIDHIQTIVERNTEQFYSLKVGNGIEIVKDPIEASVLSCIAECHPESASIGGFSSDEIGMSALFAKCYHDKMRYCDRAGRWYIYDGITWEQDSKKHTKAHACVMQFIGLLGRYSYQFIGDDSKAAFIKKVSTFVDRRFRSRLLDDAASQMNIEPAQFDASPYLINCTNGVYDLKSNTFRNAAASDYITQKTNCVGSVLPLRFPRWEQFISEVTEGDSEKAAYLQRALGYSLFGEANEECMFILHGKTTRNGKSTLLDTLRNLLGDYADTAPVDLICKGRGTRSAENASPILAKLKGKRFVTMNESDQHGKIDEATLKQYTGGEAVTARGLFQEPFTFIPQFTLWLSCNDLPNVEDPSIFASKRVRVIEFNRHFSNNEQDKDLKTLFHTPEAASAILQWLIKGYQAYRREGLQEPASIKAATKQYEKDNDVVLLFLNDRYKHDPAGFVTTDELYRTYKNWCRNSYEPMSKNKFSRELSSCTEWKLKKRDSNPRGYYGLSPLGIMSI